MTEQTRNTICFRTAAVLAVRNAVANAKLKTNRIINQAYYQVSTTQQFKSNGWKRTHTLRARTRARMHAHISREKRAHARTHARTHTHASTHTHARTHTHTHTRARAHRTPARTITHARTHTRARTRALARTRRVYIRDRRLHKGHCPQWQGNSKRRVRRAFLA